VRSIFASAAIAAVLMAAPHAAPQSIPTPPVATLTVRPTSGATTFRIGEEIALDLEFVGTADKDYFFSTETSDRSGRVNTEEYSVSPRDGTDDPLADALGGIVGGLRGVAPLNGVPFKLHVSLNDWFRFNRPGTYRVVVTSSRLHRYSAGPVDRIQSAPIDLVITAPDEAFQARTLAGALAILDRKTPDDVRYGAALLRYLGTEPAARAIVDRFTPIARAGVWDAEAAILSSPHRKAIVEAMESRIDGGDALDGNFIPTLAKVALLIDPATPAPGDASARRDRLEAIRAAYDARWHAALATHPATPETLASELARMLTVGTPSNRQQIAADVAAHPAEACTAFLSLPTDIQRALLDFNWRYLNRPWIAPALHTLYKRFHGDFRFPGIGDVALKRLIDLEPEVARPIVLDEIATGEHGITFDSLAGLPDAELPDLDQALQNRLSRSVADSYRRASDRETTLWLIARYGSTSLAPVVRKQFDERNCGLAAAPLMFLLRHDEEAATRALDTCATLPLAQLSARYWDSRVEAAAIKRLDHKDPTEIALAAQALGVRGSSAAKQPLVDRLARLNKEARSPLGLRPFSSTAIQSIDFSLAIALCQNRQFALNADDAAAIRAMCVTDSCRITFDGHLRSAK
jgi:hypothetical protein